MKNINAKHKELLDYIKKTDAMKIPRLQAFDAYAKKHNLKCETIRNLYYNLVHEYNLQDDFSIAKSKHFGANELRISMKHIIEDLNNSKSLRSACLNYSKGDAKLMLRMQNKFRSLLKTNPQFLYDLGYKEKSNKIKNFLENNRITKEKIIAGNARDNAKNATMYINHDTKPTKNSSIPAKNAIDDNKVLRMPNNNVLTDLDINNLFMGLVRMVKRSAIENAPKQLKNECELANANLKDALLKLGVSTRKLEIIKCENYELKKRLEDSERLLKNAQADVLKLLNKIDSAGKIEELKNFLQEYKRLNKEKLDFTK